MNAIECGSITALVWACGVPSTCDDRLAAGVVDHQARRHPDGVAAEQRAERQVRAGRAGRPRERVTISGAPRSAAPSVTGLASGPYSASTPCASAFMAVAVSVSRGRGGHQRRVADGQRRADRAVALVARRHAVERRERRARQRRRHGRGPARRRPPTTALAASTTRPPPNATTSRPATPSMQRGRGVGHRPGGHVQLGRRRLRQRRRASALAPARWSAAPIAARSPCRPAAPVVSAATPAPNRMTRSPSRKKNGAWAHAAGAGSVVSAGSRWSVFWPRRDRARWRWSARAGRRGRRPPWCPARRPGRWPRRPRAPARRSPRPARRGPPSRRARGTP